jgi:hypothetical protein
MTHELDEMLSFKGLRTLAMFIVKEIDERVTIDHNGPVTLNKAIDRCHAILVKAHEEMIRQGLEPRQRMQELSAIGWKIVDDTVTVEEARHARKH